MKKSWIVVPCYNEGKRLNTKSYLEFSKKNPEIGFLFVNDGSKDDTSLILKKLCDQNLDGLAYLDYKKNSGKHEAVRKGVLFLLEQKSSELIGFWDADEATPLCEIPSFLKLLQDKDSSYRMVTGCRLLRMGSMIKRKRLRHYFGRVFATCVSIILNLPVYDSQCGAKVFDSTLAKTIFRDPFTSRWFFDVELYFRMRNSLGLNFENSFVYEYPLSKWIDVDGSSLKFTDFLKVPLELLKIYIRYRRK